MKLSLYDIPGTSYIFDPILKTIEIVWLSYTLKKSNIRGIINTTSNTLIYRIDKELLWWTIISTNKILLNFDTSGMNREDDISIVFDLPESFLPNTPVKSSEDSLYRAIADLKSFARWLNRLDTAWRIRVNAESVANIWTITALTTLTTLTQANLLLDQRAIWWIDASRQVRDLSRIAFNQNFLSRLS